MHGLKRWRRGAVALVAIVALAGLWGAACGDDDEPDEPSSGQTSTTPTANGTAQPTAGSSPRSGGKVELTNVSYDPTRELYAQFNELFTEHYRQETGVEVTVNMSHGGSGSQARAIVDGLEADVATLALAGDTARLEKAGLLDSGWEAEFEHNSNPYVSTIVLLVRKGNPENIRDWADLGRDGVSVITPNPKTSGGARWNFLAAWGSVTQRGGSEDDAKDLLRRIYANVEVLDSGARGSTQTFVEKGIGDVLIAWENEALLTLETSDDFEIVYPARSILAEPAVAVVDSVVDDRGTRDVATAYIEYLYSPEAQEIIAENFYRPSDPSVLAKYAAQYPVFKEPFITIRDFGGWGAVQAKFFDDGGVFDQIYGQ